MTGEGLPVEKQPGDAVIGATLNKTGSFQFQVGKDTVLAQIVQLVQQAQSKAPIQRLADRSGNLLVCPSNDGYCGSDVRRLVNDHSNPFHGFDHCDRGVDYCLSLCPGFSNSHLRHGGNRQRR